jgi:branched-chain amino acid transport system substrate-binding protein
MADGQVVCAEAGGVPGAGRKAMDDFLAAYKARYNALAQGLAPYAYDAAYVLVAAMVSAGSTDPARYLPVLARTEGYKGVTGTITFDAQGDLRGAALTLHTYTGGRREAIAVVR